jgi:hypothetical protein
MRNALADSPPLALVLVASVILAVMFATRPGLAVQVALGASGVVLLGLYAGLRDRLR